MKNAAEYLTARCPKPFGSASGPVVRVADAEAAVQAALDDAENYRQLLAAAVRNSTTPPPSPQPVS